MTSNQDLTSGQTIVYTACVIKFRGLRSPMASRGLALVAVLLLGALSIAPLVARGPDTTPPYAASWGPTGSGVPVNTLILVGWSERMDWMSVQAAFSYTDGVLAYSQGTWI